MTLAAKLHHWQATLLDMSRRNKLLYFSLDRHPGIVFPVQDPALLFGRITTSRRPITVAALPCDLDPEELDAKLLRLRTRAREAMNDRGTQILFLAFGVLEWQETPANDETIRSPLVLVPVQLRRDGIASPYRLQLLETEEIAVNPTLREKLRRDYHVDLPETVVPADEDDAPGVSRASKAAACLEATLGAVREALPHTVASHWRVEPFVCLSVFSFTKLVMYQDLQQYQPLVLAHPLLRALGGDASRLPTPPGVLQEPDLDDHLLPHDTLQVLDADSSQQVAIQLAKNGTSFVLEGPPGTGKSQTIANMVAECLGQGKRVLFVSEKMAALEVVQRRLRTAGLGDYCLDLHSQRTDKKALITDLQECLAKAEKPRFATTDPATNTAVTWVRTADALLAARQELNAYVRALHARREPSDWTAFEVYGRLAQLHAVADLDCSLSDPLHVAPEQYRAMERALTNLLTRTDVLVGQAHHPWRQTPLQEYTEELSADIRAHFDHTASLLQQLERAVQDLDATLGGTELPMTLDGAAQRVQRVDIALRTPLPPPRWLEGTDTREVRRAAAEAQAQATTYKLRLATLTQWYRPAVIDLDPDPLRAALTEQAESLMGHLRLDGADQTERHNRPLVQADAIEQHLMHAAEVLARLADEATALAAALGYLEPTSVRSIDDLTTLVAHLLATPRPPERWLDRDAFVGIRVAAVETFERYQHVAGLRAMLLERFEPTLLHLDLAALDARFRTHAASVLRSLHLSYWRDVRLVRACLRGGIARSAAELALDVQLARRLMEEEAYLRDHRVEQAMALGRFFAGAETDWVQVQRAITWTDRLQQLLDGEPPSTQLVRLVTGGGRTLSVLQTRWQRLAATLSEWRAEATYLEELLRRGTLPADALNLDELHPADLRTWVLDRLEAFRPYWGAGRALARHRHAQPGLAGRHWTELLGDLHLIGQLRDLRHWFETRVDVLTALPGVPAVGPDTEWGVILSTLDWCEHLRAAWDGEPLSAHLVEAICAPGNAQAVAAARAARDDVQRVVELLEEEWDFYIRILPRDAISSPGVAFGAADLSQLAYQLTQLVADLPQLEAWIDFQRYWRTCVAVGLGSFLAAVAQRTPVPTNLLALFQRRFCQLWLDGVYCEIPELARFRGTPHQETIRSFCALDEEHIKHARTRLLTGLARQRARAITRADAVRTDTGRPQISPSLALRRLSDDLTALRRELGKKRHRSIRQIVQSTGSAILALKPCWMVSPLSVSQYVTADTVAFDLVIFDEASQICPEDAICSILRARQVIVVGDPKQLPPTRFFAKGITESDADDGEPEEEATFDSILDECSTVVRKRSLLWHYRSQHESLIAFSNQHFYGGRLYTFPGPQVEHAEGVRFVYVPDGQYDRGRSRTNPPEARRVAELVFEQLTQHPERSLGVVALSEAQQTAIERELEMRRRSRPDCEPFFDEQRPDAFFVKNLESVQGDERDVIILSVGYGKDASGRLYQQFGPLNGVGGERRLNVAITRARQQVVVVSSIRAEELEGASGRGGGARLLHAYLAYVERGPQVLGLGYVATGSAEEDQGVSRAPSSASLLSASLLEEQVHQALTAQGLRLAMQIGCSGYRLDLAVCDPQRSDRYLLGIECDGANYHQSPTARDRDRLRQRHLERVGWHLHRIWSRDWVRDREGEIRKVVARLQALEADAGQGEGPRIVSAATPSTAISASSQWAQVRAAAPQPVFAARVTPGPAAVRQLHTCERCVHFQAQTPTAFLCQQDATIKRRSTDGQTPGCPRWKHRAGGATD
jgi:very-short-patch-repair endonuclease